MISLEELTVQNFMTFGEKQTLELRDQGLVFVEGENRMAKKAKSNGSGKSSLIEAPLWCMTGATLRGVSPDKVVNRRIGKDCVVELYGHKDGTPFTLTRARKLRGKNHFDFVFDGKNLTSQGDPKETQRQVKQYLGVDYDIITNTVVFDGQDDKWRFTRLTDAAQKQLLDKILHIEKLTAAQRIVKDKVRVFQQTLEELQHNIDTYENTRATLGTALKSQRRERIRELRQRMLDAKRQWLRAKRSSPIEVSIADIVALEDKAKTANEEVLRLSSKIRRLREQEVVAADRHGAALLEMNEYRHRREAATALKAGESCDTCGAPITRANMKKHVHGLLKNESHYSAQADALDAEVERLQAEIGKLSVRSAERENESAKATAEARKLRQKAQSAKAHAASVKVLRDAFRKAKTAYLTAKQSKTSPALQKLEAELTSVGKKLESTRAAHATATTEYLHHKFWVDGFGNAGVKSIYLDYVVPLLNQRAHYYSQVIADDIVVEFDSESQTQKGQTRDKFQVTVVNGQGADTYEGNSGGEKRKADIIVARALQSLQEERAGTRFNMAWYDEVFESLDTTSSSVVLNLLHEDAKKYDSLFVISHQEWLQNYFNRTLRVVKDGGFSRLEWG